MALSYDKAAAALRGGDRLMVTHPNPERVSEKTTYGLVGAGKNVGVRVYRRLAENLEPVADGLFGSECSQTFRWRD